MATYSYAFVLHGTTEHPIGNAYQAIREARSMGWDTSWWEEKANTILIESGPNPECSSQMHLLLYRNTLNDLIAAVDSDGVGSVHSVKLPNGQVNPVQGSESDNPYGYASGSTTYKGWIFKEARAIDPSLDIADRRSDVDTIPNYSADPLPDVTPNTGQLVLATFEDARCLFRREGGDKRYNWYYSSYYDPLDEQDNPTVNTGYEVVVYDPDTLYAPSTLWTWAQILTDLATNFLTNGSLIDTSGFVAITHSIDSVPTEVKPENLEFGPDCVHKTPWELFCAILEATGHTLTFKPSTPKFYVVPLSHTTSTTKTALVNLFTTSDPSKPYFLDTRNSTGLHNALPETIKVGFPTANYISADAGVTEGTVAQDNYESNGAYSVDILTTSVLTSLSSTPTDLSASIYAEGFLYRTTTRYEQASPSPDNFRTEQLESVANELALRYATSWNINWTEWTIIGALDLVADQYYPRILVRFGTYRSLDSLNASLTYETQNFHDLALGCPETTVASFSPVHFLSFQKSAVAESFRPYEKTSIVKCLVAGGLDHGKEGDVSFLRPEPAVDATTTPDSLKWDFTGDEAPGTVVNLSGSTLQENEKYLAKFDYRLGKWIVFHPSNPGSTQTLNFQLYADDKKKSESSCTAKLLDDTMTPFGDSLTIYDPFNEFSSGGRDDAKGRCTLVRDADDGSTRLEITHLVGLPLVVYGTLAENIITSGTLGTDCTDAVALGAPPFNDSAAPALIHVWGETALVAGMRTGEQFVAVLDDPDATVPLYMIVSRSWSEVNVQLTGNKTKATSPISCFICTQALTSTGVTVSVYDSHATFEGASSQFGVAMLHRDGSTNVPRLEFQHINGFAEYVRGALTTDMSAGSCTIGVTDYWGGHMEGLNPGSSVTGLSGLECHDTLVTGDEVVAVRFSGITPTYMIVSSCKDGGSNYTLDPSGYIFVNGSGYLDINTITVNSFQSCSLAVVDDELVLTITYKACTVYGEVCDYYTTSTCGLTGWIDCEEPA